MLAAALAFLFLSAGLLIWELISIRALVANTEEYREVLNAALADQEQFARTRSFLAANVSARAKLNSYFTTEETAVNFLEEIEALGASAGLIATLSALDIVEGTPAKLTLSVRTEGSWQNVMHFLALVETMPRRIEITQAVLAEIPSDNKIKRWRANFDIALLSFQEKNKTP